MATLESYDASDLPRLGRSVRSIIQGRGLVALPTETFYALGADPFDERAVDRLRQAKGRDNNKPVLVLIGDLAQLPLLTQEISPITMLLMDHFWPGALTILVPAHPSLPRNLTSGTSLVGVRLSSCTPLIHLLKLIGPVTGTSANRSGGAPARTAEEVRRTFDREIDLILDAGETPGGPPSTVVESQEPVRIVREGAISRQMIQNVLETRNISLI
jgi:L-threonylcarbamoyladenylate synthase